MALNTGMDIKIRAHDEASKTIKGLESGIIRFVGAVTASIAAIKTVVFPIQQAKEFERAMKDVEKTTGFTSAEIKSLSEDFVELTQEMSVTALEFANIAAIGGQLGLGSQGVDAIKEFTKEVAIAKVTLGLTEDQAAEMGAQLTQIFDISAGEVGKVFSLLNELSNTSVATANQLGDIMRRVGDIAGLEIDQAGALAAFTRDLGVTAEVAGTSLSKFYANMQSKSEKFAAAIGISQAEWITMLETDALKALMTVSEAISHMDAVAKATSISELFGQGRQFSLGNKFVSAAANNFELLKRHSDSATESFEKGDSAAKEYAKIMESLEEQLKVLGNHFSALAITIGNELLPTILNYAKELQEFLKGDEVKTFALDMAERLKGVIDAVAEFIKWVSDLDIAWTNVIQVIKIFIGLQLVQMMFNLAKSITTTTVALTVMGATWGGVFAFIGTWITQTVRGILGLSVVTTAAGQAVSATQAAQAASTAAATGSLAKLSAALAATSNAWKAYSINTTAAAGVTVSFGRAAMTTLGLIGATINIVLGPLLLIGSLIWIFWDDIKKVLGLVNREAEKAAAAEKANARKAREDLEAELAKFRQFVSSSFASFDMNITAHFELEGVVAAQEKITATIREFVRIGEGLSSISSMFSTISATVERYNGYLDIAARRMEILQQYGASPAIIEAQEQRTAALESELEKYTEIQNELLDTFDMVSSQYAEVAEAIGSLATPELLKWLDTAELVTEATAKLTSMNEELADIGKLMEGEEVGTRAYAELEEQYKALTVEIAFLNAEMLKADAAYAQQRGNLTLAQLAIVKYVDALKEAGKVDEVKTFVAVQKVLSDGQPNATQQELVSTMQQQIDKQILLRHESGKAIEVFEKSTRKVRSMIKSINGQFDNLYKSLTTLRLQIEATDREMDRIIKDSTVDIELKIKNQKLDEQLDRELTTIEERYQRLIDRVSNPDSYAGQSRIKFLKAERDHMMDRIRNEREAKKLQEEQDQKAKKFADSYGKVLSLVKEYEGIQQQLDTFDGLSLADKQKLIEKQQGLKAEINETYKAAVDGAKDLAGSTDLTTFMSSGLLDMAEQFFPEDSKRDVQTRLKQLGGILLKFTEDSGIDMKESADALTEAMDEAVASSKAMYQSSGEALQNFSKISEGVAEYITAMSASMAAGSKSLEEATNRLDTIVKSGDIWQPPSAEEWQKYLDGFKDTSILFLKESLTGFTQDLKSGINLTVEKAAPSLKIKDINLEEAAKALKPINAKLASKFENAQLKEALTDAAPNGLEIIMKPKFDMNSLGGISPTSANYPGVQNNARGGYIQGPGTGTSDSILSWLSNGEYVMDAWSTRYFGSNFFKNLQSIARSGGGKLKIPGFKNGGLVNESPTLLADTSVLKSLSAAGGDAQVAREVMELVLRDPTTGAPTSRLSGSRDSVNALVDVLKQIKRV